MVKQQQTEEATGAGELAITIVAPAIANAIFDATGARIRQVPFTPERVKAALKEVTQRLLAPRHLCLSRRCSASLVAAVSPSQIPLLFVARNFDPFKRTRQRGGGFGFPSSRN